MVEVAVFHQQVVLLIHSEIGRFDGEEHGVSGTHPGDGTVADHLQKNIFVTGDLMGHGLQRHLDVGGDGGRQGVHAYRVADIEPGLDTVPSGDQQ